MDKKYVSLLNWTGILLPEMMALAEKATQNVPADSVLRSPAAIRVIGVLSDAVRHRGKDQDPAVAVLTKNVSRLMRLTGIALNEGRVTPDDPSSKKIPRRTTQATTEIEMLGIQLSNMLQISSDAVVSNHPEIVEAISTKMREPGGELEAASVLSGWIEEAIADYKSKYQAKVPFEGRYESFLVVMLRAMTAIKLASLAITANEHLVKT